MPGSMLPTNAEYMRLLPEIVLTLLGTLVLFWCSTVEVASAKEVDGVSGPLDDMMEHYPGFGFVADRMEKGMHSRARRNCYTCRCCDYSGSGRALPRWCNSDNACLCC